MAEVQISGNSIKAGETARDEAKKAGLPKKQIEAAQATAIGVAAALKESQITFYRD